ncbi:hypothetical protein I5U56_13555 [Stenotrophomonas maltophilia]|nr:hypothetical protein [Stenotrophomonas maltophilia]MBH1601708.1 hypothetical protein [Stenotrophomonas maltophilia]
MALIALDDPRWGELQHAYGAADDIPELLANLIIPKGERSEDDPIEDTWHELWSSLCHQGDVYTASFAAVPHIVNALPMDSDSSNWQFISLPQSIETLRCHKGVELPAGLEPEYSQAIQRMGKHAAMLVATPQEAWITSALFAAIAIAHGHTPMARLHTEISSDEMDQAVNIFFAEVTRDD